MCYLWLIIEDSTHSNAIEDQLWDYYYLVNKLSCTSLQLIGDDKYMIKLNL